MSKVMNGPNHPYFAMLFRVAFRSSISDSAPIILNDIQSAMLCIDVPVLSFIHVNQMWYLRNILRIRIHGFLKFLSQNGLRNCS